MRILFAVLWIFIYSSLAWADTHYMATTGGDSGTCDGGNPCLTLEYAVSQMSGGDTLTISDGSYSGATNVLDQAHMPPSGSAGAPTVIQAENDGGAVFPDSFLNMTNTASVSYVDFIGLKSDDSLNLGGGTDHFRIMRCAITNTIVGTNSDAIVSIRGTYHLIEDSYVWGDGRYGMYAASGAPGDTEYIVFRRCVVRLDKVNVNDPFAPFQSYSNPNVVFQNCIAIDGAEKFFILYEERAGCFYSRTAGPVKVTGSICLNYPSYFAGGSPSNSLTITNSVAWDVGSGVIADFKTDSDGAWSIANLTMGGVSGFVDPVTPGDPNTCNGDGVLAKNGIVDGSILNSIFYNIDAGIGSAAAITGADAVNDYCDLYGNATNYTSVSGGANNLTTDPLDGSLEYLTRIESGSALAGSGSGGADIGATILCKIGTDGSYHSDSGWDTTRACPLQGDGGSTADNLWPWPHEDRIKTDMASYTWTGTDQDGTADQTLSGARGFAASTANPRTDTGQITLTSYIWEYLGNTGATAGLYGIDTGQSATLGTGSSNFGIGTGTSTITIQ